jgi:hypothetical protein
MSSTTWITKYILLIILFEDTNVANIFYKSRQI